MIKRCYVLPLILGTRGFREPKYCVALGIRQFWVVDFGMEDLALVLAMVTAEQHTSLIANSDVYSLPENLDTALTAAEVIQVKQALESIRIPGDLIAVGWTWRQVIGFTFRLFQFIQRLATFGKHPYPPTVTLDSKWNTMPAPLRNDLIACAESMGYPTTLMTGTNLYRTILNDMSLHFEGPCYLGGEVF
jgi:hypothetical protein